MSFIAITNWDTTEWSDEMVSIAQDKFVPMILAVGASGVKMLRTGDLSFSVVTEYADAKTAEAAQDKIAKIRAQATEELPMKLASTQAGEVFSSS